MGEPFYPRALPPLRDGEFDLDVAVQAGDVPFGVRWCKREHVGPKNPMVDYHSPRYAALRYCLDGEGVFSSGTERWPLRAGMFNWHGPDTTVSLAVPPGGGIVNYVVLLFGSELAQRFRDHLPAAVGVSMLAEPAQVGRLMEEVLAEALAGSAGRDANAAALAEVALRRADVNIAAADPHYAVSRQTYRRIRQHIDDHSLSISTLAEVASTCGVTVQYLCRIFERFHGGTAYDYLTSLKIARAERMLLDSRTSVVDVGRAVGYQDSKLFSRKFRAFYGKSPMQYRQAKGRVEPEIAVPGVASLKGEA